MLAASLSSYGLVYVDEADGLARDGQGDGRGIEFKGSVSLSRLSSRLSTRLRPMHNKGEINTSSDISSNATLTYTRLYCSSSSVASPETDSMMKKRCDPKIRLPAKIVPVRPPKRHSTAKGLRGAMKVLVVQPSLLIAWNDRTIPV